MQASRNLFARDDTMLGVCEALGEDLRINPLFLRLAFALPLIWFPVGAICAYLGAGVIVAMSRLVFPKPRPAIAQSPAAATELAGNENAELLLAAA
jgi:phage shock protein PspC (stress-responsive transcriptional regulator)